MCYLYWSFNHKINVIVIFHFFLIQLVSFWRILLIRSKYQLYGIFYCISFHSIYIISASWTFLRLDFCKKTFLIIWDSLTADIYYLCIGRMSHYSSVIFLLIYLLKWLFIMRIRWCNAVGTVRFPGSLYY